MRRRWLIASNEIAFRVACWARGHVELLYRRLDNEATDALWRADHARGGEYAARWRS